MQNFRPFPRWVFQKMPGYPKFDPFHEVKIAPKLENHQTVTIIYLVLKVVGIQQHTIFQAIPCMRSAGNARKPQIWPVSLVKIMPKLQKNQQTVTLNDTVLKVVKIHQHAKFQAIASMCSPRYAWKPQIWPVSLSQNSAKIRKIIRPWP